MSDETRVSIPVVFVATSLVAEHKNIEELFELPPGSHWLRVEAETSVLDGLDAILKPHEDFNQIHSIYVEIDPALRLQDAINDLNEFELETLVEFELHTVVSVLHAPTLVRSLLRDAPVIPEGVDIKAPSDGSRVRLPELLVERIEFAEFFVLTGTENLDAAILTQAESLLRRLNPSGKVWPVEISKHLAAADFLTPDLYDVEKAELSAGWLSEIAGEFEGRGNENGVDSFSFRAHRPFHPERLAELLEQFDLPGMVRGSGRIWIATRHQEMGVLSLTTGTAWMVYGGVWFAAMPASGWPTDSDAREAIMEGWELPYGDRCQELAFIGVNMDMKSIRKQLNRCLLSEEEMRDGPDSWRNFSDPLPEWYGPDEDKADDSAPEGSGQLS